MTVVEITWEVSEGSTVSSKKLPYVPPWKTFSKLPEEEKEKIFNAMRGECILAGLMENK